MAATDESKLKNLGRAELTVQLRACGLSRRLAKRILDFILDEMKKALAPDEPVEFPPGWLVRKYKISPHWELINDEPMQRYTIEYKLDVGDIYVGCPGFKPPKSFLRTLSSRRPRGRPRERPKTEVPS